MMDIQIVYVTPYFNRHVILFDAGPASIDRPANALASAKRRFNPLNRMDSPNSMVIYVPYRSDIIIKPALFDRI